LVLVLSAILVVSISAAPAVYGQTDNIIKAPITVATDKDTYETGESITVSGEVSRAGAGDVSIEIVGPDDSQNRVGIQQSSVNMDGTYDAVFTAGGLMNKEGTYTVKVYYGVVNVATASSSFGYVHVVTETPSDETDDMEEPEVEVADNVFPDRVTMEGTEDMIMYDITGGKILSVTPNVNSTSLVITIQADEDGVLTMTIPRTILDAKDGEEDDSLYVLVDYEEAVFDEEITETDRTVTIEFMAGTEVIELIGTFVIPEFGVIAVMILAAAIVSVIVITSRRTSLNIMTPRL